MAELTISADVIDFIMAAARNTYPNEFIGLLRMREGVVKEVVIPPLSTYGQSFSSFRHDMLPADENVVGIVHSHPSRSSQPSRQDLNLFAQSGRYHMIICYPYRLEDISLYDKDGKRAEYKVVD